MAHNLLLQNLESALEELGKIPLYGSAPHFPLDSFAEKLTSTFDIDPLHLELDRPPQYIRQFLPLGNCLRHPKLGLGSQRVRWLGYEGQIRRGGLDAVGIRNML